MHAIILAGGFGTRLKSVVADVPKPLAPINGKPFLELLINRLIDGGVTSVTLSVHHMKEQMEAFAKQDFGIPVDVMVEENPLGTGGAMVFCLKNEKKETRNDDPVLVLNGDSFVKLDYRRLREHHLKKGAPLTLALRRVPDTSRYSEVITRNNRVIRFDTLGGPHAGFINAGVYMMDRDLFGRFPMEQEAFSFERDFMPKYVKQLKAASFIADEYFIDIGVPEDYARAQVELS